MIDRDFKVGDKVTCNMYGLGEVVEIDNDYITVIFSNKIIGTYSKDGKYNIILNYNTYENSFNKKYITKENIDKIVEQMNEFIKEK